MTNKPERLSADDIFEILRNRICLLEYLPGSILREATLAQEFGVSRTPMRTVLQKLAHGGLISSRDGVGTIVTELSHAELIDIYQMRIKLAEMIGQMTPKPLTQNHQKAASALLGRAKTLTSQFDADEYWRINHDLHFLIMEIIGNAALRQMWDHYYYLAARMWYQKVQSKPEDAAPMLVSELQEVTRAILEKDATALGYAQRNYIAYGMARL